MHFESLYYFTALDGPANEETFASFLVDLLAFIGDNPEAMLIMDNVRFHKTLGIRNMLDASVVGYKYLPSYSPQLNPIENLFGVWKQCVRRMNYNDKESLDATIHAASETITTNMCANMYRRMEDNVNRELNGVDMQN